MKKVSWFKRKRKRWRLINLREYIKEVLKYIERDIRNNNDPIKEQYYLGKRDSLKDILTMIGNFDKPEKKISLKNLKKFVWIVLYYERYRPGFNILTVCTSKKKAKGMELEYQYELSAYEIDIIKARLNGVLDE